MTGASPPHHAVEKPDLTAVDRIVEAIGDHPGAVVPLLQAIQEEYNYLPEEALRRVAALTSISPATLHGVATFYDLFRFVPRGRHVIHVCCGTACHAKGAERLHDTLRHRLQIPAHQDTDPEGEFTVERVPCMGCCTLAPVLRIDDLTYGYLSPDRIDHVLRDFARAARVAQTTPDVGPQGAAGLAEIRVGLGSCCVAKGSDRLYENLRQTVEDIGAPVIVKRVGCVGMCHQTPLVEVCLPGQEPVTYARVGAEEARNIVLRHFKPRSFGRRLRLALSRVADQLLTDEEWEPVTRYGLDTRDPRVSGFLGPQVHLATEGFGSVDPGDIADYERHGGFQALRRAVLDGSPEEVLREVDRSGLRGRGGAGFPTGAKWAAVRAAEGEEKFVVCNGDEGDPGAFMDRMILESFPHRVIEGLTLAAYAVGAQRGYLYIRAEYGLAVRRVRTALKQCEERGFLGEHVLGADFSLHLEVQQGAGAFVCGEETALLASLEGRRGNPRLRPPYPSERGLFGKPTLIGNVETLALVPWILRHGAARFAELGVERSRGTKVFALAGKVQRGGLIEVPMGMTLRRIVEDIGGGVDEGRTFKAVQIGGPSGGCVPAELADTPVDYESLVEVGAIMGSGGLVVLDDTDCMVDMARYFMEFIQRQSCGQCTLCRIGTRRMLEILEALCTGKGSPSHLDELERLARNVGKGSLCALGRTAPNPVLSTLRYFRDEYEAHLEGRCPAGKCRDLIRYFITDACTGCTLCAQHCPYDAIALTPYEQHRIDAEKCQRCGICREVCPHDAVAVR